MPGPLPTSGADAVSTVPVRSQALIKYFACGQENEFLTQSLQAQQDPSRFKSLLYFVIAKLEWLKISNADCLGKFNVTYKNGTARDFFDNPLFQCQPPTPMGCTDEQTFSRLSGRMRTSA
jgi:hypothetical protein